jgi:hypothetical protein
MYGFLFLMDLQKVGLLLEWPNKFHLWHIGKFVTLHHTSYKLAQIQTRHVLGFYNAKMKHNLKGIIGKSNLHYMHFAMATTSEVESLLSNEP